VADKAFLEDFRRTWKYDHPLEKQQLDSAGAIAKIKTVGFYHGGDVLYTLKELPGIWHEECLSAA
jgi:hypothetical protein